MRLGKANKAPISANTIPPNWRQTNCTEESRQDRQITDQNSQQKTTKRQQKESHTVMRKWVFCSWTPAWPKYNAQKPRVAGRKMNLQETDTTSKKNSEESKPLKNTANHLNQNTWQHKTTKNTICNQENKVKTMLANREVRKEKRTHKLRNKNAIVCFQRIRKLLIQHETATSRSLSHFELRSKQIKLIEILGHCEQQEKKWIRRFQEEDSC